MDVLEIKKPFRMSFNLLRIFGLWIDGKESRKYRVYGISLIILFPISFLIMTLIQTLKSGYSIEVAESMTFIFTTSIEILRIIDFLTKINSIKFLHNSIGEMLKQVKNVNFVKIRMINCCKIFVLTDLMTFVFVTSGFMVSFLYERKLPYSIALPFEVDDCRIGFWITFSYLLISTCYMGLVYMTLGLLPIFFMSFIVGFMEDLNERLENFGKNIEKDKIETEMLSTELREIIEMQKSIKKFIGSTSNIFQLTYIIIGLAGHSVFCTTMFVMPLVSFEKK